MMQNPRTFACWQKGKIAYRWPGKEDQIRSLIDRLHPIRPILVNVQSVYDRVYGTSLVFKEFENLIPPHKHMWLEWTAQVVGLTVPLAVLVIHEPRTEPPPHVEPSDQVDSFVYLHFLECAQDGIAEYIGFSAFGLDSLGRMTSDEDSGMYLPESLQEDPGNVTILAQIAGEALTTMNTVGTIVEPPWPQGPPRKPIHRKHPFSVWHTLSLPASVHLVPRGSSSQDEKEPSGRREHPVRWHRRDCREHPLFGKYSGIFNIPEHTRGNPDLGSVHRSYKLK